MPGEGRSSKYCFTLVKFKDPKFEFKFHQSKKSVSANGWKVKGQFYENTLYL